MEQANFVDFQGDVKDDLFDILEEKWNVDPDCIEDIGNVKRWALPAPTRVITHQKPSTKNRAPNQCGTDNIWAQLTKKILFGLKTQVQYRDAVSRNFLT